MANSSDPIISVSFRLSKSLVQRTRRVARDFAGRPAYLSLSKLVSAALEHELAKYEGLDQEQSEPPPVRRVNSAATIRRRL